MTTPIANPAQAAFATRNGFIQNPTTGTYTARAKWAGRSGWLEVSVFAAEGGEWEVVIMGEDLRGSAYRFPTAREAWACALYRLGRILRLSKRNLLPA
jgi:hypothetical protein